jgi:hypothetical protein
MNRMRIACTKALCVLFTAVAFASQGAGYALAQEDSPRTHAAAPQPQEPEAKPEKPEKQENAKPEKPAKEREKEVKHASQSSQAAHAHPAGKSAHIPDDKFRANFGRSHTFVINKTVVVNDQPTFVYGGYSFIVLDTWPVGWAYTDECYVDYIDGEYFLFDVLHPGVRIALFVTM